MKINYLIPSIFFILLLGFKTVSAGTILDGVIFEGYQSGIETDIYENGPQCVYYDYASHSVTKATTYFTTTSSNQVMHCKQQIETKDDFYSALACQVTTTINDSGVQCSQTDLIEFYLGSFSTSGYDGNVVTCWCGSYPQGSFSSSSTTVTGENQLSLQITESDQVLIINGNGFIISSASPTVNDLTINGFPPTSNSASVSYDNGSATYTLSGTFQWNIPIAGMSEITLTPSLARGWSNVIINSISAVCTEGQTQRCYDGPAGTRGVGQCRDGIQTCVSGHWGGCQGATLPQPEICDGLDNNCDGQIDEDLTRPCYDGPFGTKDVGICKAGIQSCMNGQWEMTCHDEILPVPGACSHDQSCGQPGPTCCHDGETKKCYTLSTGTPDVGVCRYGTQFCIDGNWSPECLGQIGPDQNAATCDGIDHLCNGNPNAGCDSLDQCPTDQSGQNTAGDNTGSWQW